MKFFQFPPHKTLRSTVECYWIVEGTDIFSNRIVPDGYPEIIFHYGDAFQIQSNGKMEVQSSSLAAGQLTKPISLTPTGNTGVFGIKFKPSGMWNLFHRPMYLLQDQSVLLDDALGIKSNNIVERLKDCSAHPERIQIVEQFLLHRLNSVKTSFVDSIIAKLLLADGQMSVRNVCRDENISERKLERSFKTVIGLTPKQYMRILRFNKAFRLLQQSSFSRVDAAFLCGYFDQSHFNKDFRNFSGDDPQTYFAQNHSFANFFLNR